MNLHTDQTKCTFEYTVIERTKEIPNPNINIKGKTEEAMQNTRNFSTTSSFSSLGSRKETAKTSEVFSKII